MQGLDAYFDEKRLHAGVPVGECFDQAPSGSGILNYYGASGYGEYDDSTSIIINNPGYHNDIDLLPSSTTKRNESRRRRRHSSAEVLIERFITSRVTRSSLLLQSHTAHRDDQEEPEEPELTFPNNDNKDDNKNRLDVSLLASSSATKQTRKRRSNEALASLRLTNNALIERKTRRRRRRRRASYSNDTTTNNKAQQQQHQLLFPSSCCALLSYTGLRVPKNKKINKEDIITLLHATDWNALCQIIKEDERGLLAFAEIVVSNQTLNETTLLYNLCQTKAPIDIIQLVINIQPDAIIECLDDAAKNQQNLLHVAIANGQSVDVVMYIIHIAPHLATQVDKNDATPLHTLCSSQRLPKNNKEWKHKNYRRQILKLVNTLCCIYPESITMNDHNNKTPLCYAKEDELNQSIIQILKKHHSKSSLL